MKKKKQLPAPRQKSAVVIPSELNKEFRKVCINMDLKPAEVIKKIIGVWIDKEKKKLSPPLVANG